MNNRQQFERFLDGLSEDGLDRLLRKLTSHIMQWPLTYEEWSPLELKAAGRPKTKAQEEVLAQHAEAVALLAVSRTAWEAALGELRAAERKRGPEDASGIRLRTGEQEADVGRLAAIAEERKDELDAALAAELAARPHQPAKRRRGLKFPLAGVFAKAGVRRGV